METIEYGELIKDTKVLHLSTQTTSCIPLNGSMKSKAAYDVRGYLNFENDDTIEYITLQVPYVVMSNSNYIVNQYNNTLIIYVNNEFYYSYTLPLGNYTAATFRTLLLSVMPLGFALTYNTTVNKYTFTFNQPFSLMVGSTCDYIIGFSGTETATLVGALYTLTCSRAFNFLPIPRYVIHCNILNDGVILGVNSTMGASDILATIPNVSKPNGQLVYENIASEFLIKTLNFGQIVITITDDNNREIDFLGISSYFLLKFNIFRRSLKKPMKFQSLAEYINKIPVPADETIDEQE
jgi:hypothetical protein